MVIGPPETRLQFESGLIKVWEGLREIWFALADWHNLRITEPPLLVVCHLHIHPSFYFQGMLAVARKNHSEDLGFCRFGLHRLIPRRFKIALER